METSVAVEVQFCGRVGGAPAGEIFESADGRHLPSGRCGKAASGATATDVSFLRFGLVPRCSTLISTTPTPMIAP